MSSWSGLFASMELSWSSEISTDCRCFLLFFFFLAMSSNYFFVDSYCVELVFMEEVGFSIRLHPIGARFWTAMLVSFI